MGIYNVNYVAWGYNIVKMAGGWFSDLWKKTYVLWHQSIPQHDCRCKYRKAGPIASQAPFHIANNCWHQPGLFKPSEQTSSLELHVLQRTTSCQHINSNVMTKWWKLLLMMIQQPWFFADRSGDEFRTVLLVCFQKTDQILVLPPLDRMTNWHPHIMGIMATLQTESRPAQQ